MLLEGTGASYKTNTFLTRRDYYNIRPSAFFFYNFWHGQDRENQLMPLERGPLNTFVSKNTKFESDFAKTNEDIAQTCEILQTKLNFIVGVTKLSPPYQSL